MDTPDYQKFPCCGYEHRWLPGSGKWVSTKPGSKCSFSDLAELEQRQRRRPVRTAPATQARMEKLNAKPTDNRLKLARRAADMTTLQLAVAAGVHVNTIANMEKDMSAGCNTKTAEALSSVLGVSPAWLVGWES